MLHHARPARRALVALTVASVALAACGGDDGDDEVASATTEAASTTTASTTTAPTTAPATTEAAAAPSTSAADDTAGDTSDATSDEGPASTIIVESFDDMPPECRQIMVDFLKTIEPTVSAYDWENTATLGDFQVVSETLDVEFTAMDETITETGCDAYDFADDADSIGPMIEIAEAEAPGTVGWLQFLVSLSEEPVTNPALPQDCDGAIAYVEDLIASAGTMNEVPFKDLTDVSQVLSTIQSACDPTVAGDFLARPDVTEFLS